MLPVLVEIGSFKLYSYTVFYALAFVVGLWSLRREAQTNGIELSKINKLFVPIFILSIIGARLYYSLGAKLYLGDQASLWSLLTRGGLAFYGGLLLCCLFLFLIAPKLKIQRAALFNSFAPALLLGQAIGRIGCLLNGCCHGSVCTLPWGVKLPVEHGQPGWGLSHHPSQAYESIALLLLYFAIKHGKLTWPTWKIYLFGYGCIRFFVEFTRGDEIRGILGPLSLSQWVSLGLIAASLFLDLFTKGNHNVGPDET